jgi:SAM-dependent methyltransferase
MKAHRPFDALPDYPRNAVLKTVSQVNESVRRTQELGLPVHLDAVKNWDSLAALSVVTKHLSKTRNSKILDAGGENYSVILKQLQQVGFKDLTCINLVFNAPHLKQGIRFQFGDITKTGFAKNYFDAITCLSVIEHGVDINTYFAEMSRILKPGGMLFTSIDYWSTPVDTAGRIAYGVPIKIFDRRDVVKMVAVGLENGLELMDELELNCRRKVVSWKQFNLDYTFLYFTMRKR